MSVHLGHSRQGERRIPALQLAFHGVLAFAVLYGLIVYTYPYEVMPMMKDGLVGALVLAAVILHFIRFTATPSKAMLTTIVLVLLASAWATLGVWAGVSSGASAVDAMLDWRFYGLYPLIALLPMVAVRDVNGIEVYCRFIVEIGVCIAIVGLVFYSFPAIDPTNQLSQLRSGITSRAVIGTLGNRPAMGMFSVMIFAATHSARGYMLGRSRIVAQAILAFAILLTFSRTSYAGLALCLLLSQTTAGGRGKHFRVVATLAVLLVIVAYTPEVTAPLGRAFEAIDPSLSGRTRLWDDIQDNLTFSGYGLGHFGHSSTFIAGAAMSPRTRLGAADNEFLKLVGGLGIGAIFTFALIAVSLVKYHRMARTWKLASGFYLQLAAATLMSMGMDWFHAIPISMMFWWAIGLLPVLTRFQAIEAPAVLRTLVPPGATAEQQATDMGNRYGSGTVTDLGWGRGT